MLQPSGGAALVDDVHPDGVKNLYKKHNNDCRNREPLRCDWPRYGRYKHVNVNPARWSGQYIDPRRRQHAVVVLNRLRVASTWNVSSASSCRLLGELPTTSTCPGKIKARARSRDPPGPLDEP